MTSGLRDSLDRSTSPIGRWDTYVLESGEALRDLWAARKDGCKRVLLLVGHGFDPRMCVGARLLASAGILEKTDLRLLDYSDGAQPATAAVAALVEQNREAAKAIGGSSASFDIIPVPLRSADGRRIGARSASSLVSTRVSLDEFSDIIIDISALPRTLYFPLVGALLDAVDRAGRNNHGAPNIHLLVAESSTLDRRIVEEGVEARAEYLHGFAGGLDQEATRGMPTLWIPLLGESQNAQLAKIYDLVVPDEICPVLPSPSVNPRRADDLVLEYRELLFDRLRIEPRNLLYAAEQNPFEVYHQLRRTVLRYEQALRPLGGCKTAVSVLSSKLMSVGALLAAYEMKATGHQVGIAHVESHGYVPDDSLTPGDVGGVEVFGLWLTGACYAN